MPLRRSGFPRYQCLNVLRPQLESLSHFLGVAMPLIDSSNTAESAAAVVQCQLDNLWSNSDSLQSARETASKIMKRPRRDCWSNLFLRSTMVAKWTICAVQHKVAGTWQSVEYTADHRRDRFCVAARFGWHLYQFGEFAPMTLGNMRANGVRTLAVWCGGQGLNNKARHPEGDGPSGRCYVRSRPK
jgi:hypothetical protein